jgi:hypothetical protein
MDVHRRITANALNSSLKGFWNKVSKDVFSFSSAIIGYYAYEESYKSGSVVAPDLRSLPTILGGEGKKSINSEHFDDMSYSQIAHNFSSISANINAAVNKYSSGDIDSFQLGQVVGEYYHAIQDFYSHSNYIELYEKLYGQTNVKSIPHIQRHCQIRNMLGLRNC